MKLKRSLFLCGFMGVGKSTVGKLLSEKLACPFIDLDQIIVQHEHASIPQIFSQKGEAHFRSIETQCLRSLSTQNPSVIALGGGTLNLPENSAFVTHSGELIYLAADPKTLEDRLGPEASTRPLLAGVQVKDRSSHIAKLMNAREDIYSKAKYRISTDMLSPQQTVDKILAMLPGGLLG